MRGPDALARRREAKAVQLRAARLSYDEIAAYVLPCPEHDAIDGLAGCDDCRPLYANRSGAQKAVERVLRREYAESAGDRALLVSEALASADAVITRMAADLHNARLDPADRARAGTVLLRALDHKARITGTYAPTRVTVTDELDESIAALVAELSGTAPAERVET